MSRQRLRSGKISIQLSECVNFWKWHSNFETEESGNAELWGEEGLARVSPKCGMLLQIFRPNKLPIICAKFATYNSFCHFPAKLGLAPVHWVQQAHLTCHFENFGYGGWGRTLLSGWGRVEEGGDWSRTLKRARTPIVSDRECTRNVSNDNESESGSDTRTWS